MARAPRTQKKKKLGRGKRFATGVDIGTYSIIISTVVGDEAGQLDIPKITVVPLAEPELGETQEQRLERQKDGLKEAMKKHGKMPGKIVLGFPRHLATTRYINFPSAKREEIKEMLLFDVERHVPFTVEELEMSYQKLEQLSDHETRLMMVCVPKKEILPYVEMCLDVGLRFDEVDLDILGDSTAYTYDADPTQILGIVNLGRSSVDFVVMQDHKPIFNRSLPVTEKQLLRHFPGTKTWRDLQGRITAAGPVNPNEKKYYEEWMQRLGTELSRCLRAFECEQEGRKLSRIVFCGGAGYFPSGALRGLQKYIHMQPVIETALNGVIPASSEYNGTELSTSIGLGLRGLRSKPDDLNLLPQSYIDHQIHQQKSAFRKNVAIMAFMVITLLCGTVYLNWHLKYEQYSQLQSFYSKLSKEYEEIKKMKGHIDTVETYLDSEHSCTNVLKDVLAVFRDSKCFISKITFNKQESLEITGQVLTEKAVDTIHKELNKMVYEEGEENPKGYFSWVTQSSDSHELNLNTTNLNVRSFTFRCTLWSGEEENRNYF